MAPKPPTFGAPRETRGAPRSKWRDRSMPSDDTRRVLKVFGVAVTSLEDAIDGKAPMAEIMKWDAELADRTREIIALVDRLRSRRIG